MSVIVPLAYPAAIPVGHRVELTWRVNRGRRRGSKPTPSPHEPFLLDLDTGVGIGPEWQLGDFVAFRADHVHAYAVDPLPQLEVERTLRGRVVSCTIVHVTLPDPYQQTILVLDEED